MKKKHILLLLIVAIIGLMSFYIYFEMSKEEESYYDIVNYNQLDIIKEENDYVILYVKQDGCYHCDQVEPIVNDLAKEETYKVVSIIGNREGNEDIYENLNISGTPTIVFFLNGKEMDKIDGEFNKETLERKVEEIYSEESCSNCSVFN